MPVDAAEIRLWYSGGAGNTDPNASLGGARGTTDPGAEVTDNVKNDLFSNTTPAQASAGTDAYRGIYVMNHDGALAAQDIRCYISTGTGSADDELDIAIADEAVNVTIETIANEETAPVGPVFSHPTTYAGGLQLNGATGLTAGSYKGLWIRKTTNPGAAAATDNTGTLTTEWVTS